MPKDPLYFWCTSCEPDMEQAEKSGIIIAPSVMCKGDVIPIHVYDGTLRKIMGAPSHAFPRNYAMFLDVCEMDQGVTVQYPDGVSNMEGDICLKPGHVIVKVWPWQTIKRRLLNDHMEQTCGHREVQQPLSTQAAS